MVFMPDIKYVTKNIFNTGADILVNPVNTVGVMGAGLAKQFKKRFPDSHADYVYLCKNGFLKICKPTINFDFQNDQLICLFPTKKHFSELSSLDNILQGLEYMNSSTFTQVSTPRGESIAFPKLGCGLGGLDWKELRPKMHEILEKMNYEEIFVCE